MPATPQHETLYRGRYGQFVGRLGLWDLYCRVLNGTSLRVTRNRPWAPGRLSYGLNTYTISRESLTSDLPEVPWAGYQTHADRIVWAPIKAALRTYFQRVNPRILEINMDSREWVRRLKRRFDPRSLAHTVGGWAACPKLP